MDMQDALWFTAGAVATVLIFIFAAWAIP